MYILAWRVDIVPETTVVSVDEANKCHYYRFQVSHLFQSGPA